MNIDLQKTLLKEGPFGYALHEILVDKHDTPVDYVYLEVNDLFRELTGIGDKKIEGKRVTEVFPGIDKDSFDWIDFFGDVALNQTKKECEQYSQVLDHWYKVTAISPVKNKFIAIFTDITWEKIHKNNNELLLNLSENLLTGISDKFSYADITQKILKLSDAKYAIFNLFSENQKTVTNKAVCGNLALIKKTFKLLGFSLENKTWEVSEKRKKDLSHKTFIEFSGITEIAEESVPAFLCNAISELIGVGKTYEIIIRFEEKILGSFMLFMDKNKTLANPHQVLTYTNIVGIAINRWSTEKKLIRQNDRFSHLISSTNTGTWEWNVQSGQTIFNERWAEIVGYKLEELQPTSIETWFDLAHPDDVDISKKALEKHFKGDSDYYNVEIRIRHKDGHWVWIHDKGKVISFTEDGRPEWMFGTHMDISDRKQAEKELLKAKEKAEESDRLKSAFLANMSHEIRTPMNAIIGFASFLSEGQITPEESMKYGKYILQSGDHLLNLINDIIDISKIDAGEINICIATTDVNDMLDEIYNLFFHTSTYIKDKKHITLKRVKPEQGIIIETDATRLKQILINLIANAFKFTHTGHVEFGLKGYNSNEISFYVKDTGIGIDPTDQKRIFERFKQASISTEKIYGGTGLGLTIAKELVSLLGGDIGLNSTKGEGSEFFFNLPLNLGA